MNTDIAIYMELIILNNKEYITKMIKIKIMNLKVKS